MPADVHPEAAWAAVGAEGAVAFEGVELRLLELAFRRPVRTARGVHRRRPLVLVRVAGTVDGEAVEGWGECAALADTSYDREDAGGAWDTLERALVPALVAEGEDGEGRLPPVAGLAAVAAAAPGSPLSFAALEMAVADAHLRAAGVPFADLVGVGTDTVVAGAVVGQADSEAELLGRVDALVAEGYPRVKLKIGPGDDLGPVGAVRRRHPDLLLQVDANESYAPDDWERLGRLDPFDLLCIEQPFDRGDLDAHARLADRIRTPVCLDESLSSPGAVEEALDRGACSVVCVKPARLGGLGAALQVVESCRRRGVPLWIGGMFESAYARGVNATIAALPGFAWPGDLSPAGTALVDDLAVTRRGRADAVGRGPGNRPATVRVSRVAGMGVTPDPAAVARLTARRTVLSGPGRRPGGAV